MKLPKEAPIDKLVQRKAIKRKSDELLGKTNMDFDTFCKAIDEEIHDNLMVFYDGVPMYHVKPMVISLAKYNYEKHGTPYYDSYLNEVVK